MCARTEGPLRLGRKWVFSTWSNSGGGGDLPCVSNLAQPWDSILPWCSAIGARGGHGGHGGHGSKACGCWPPEPHWLAPTQQAARLQCCRCWWVWVRRVWYLLMFFFWDLHGAYNKWLLSTTIVYFEKNAGCWGMFSWIADRIWFNTETTLGPSKTSFQGFFNLKVGPAQPLRSSRKASKDSILPATPTRPGLEMGYPWIPPNHPKPNGFSSSFQSKWPFLGIFGYTTSWDKSA